MRLTRRAEYRRHLILLALLMLVALYLMQRGPVHEAIGGGSGPASPTLHVPQLGPGVGAGGSNLSHLTIAKSD